MGEVAQTEPALPDRLPPALARALPAIRREHGPDLLFMPEYEIIVRPCTREEVVAYTLNLQQAPLSAQLDLFRKCLAYPEDWDALMDRLSTRTFVAVFQGFWDGSGFHNHHQFAEDLNSMRLFILERDHAIIRLVCRAFPSLTPQELNKMNRQTLLYHVAQAESILNETWDGQDYNKVMEPIINQARQREIEEAKRAQKRTRIYDWKKDRTAYEAFEHGDS